MIIKYGNIFFMSTLSFAVLIPLFLAFNLSLINENIRTTGIIDKVLVSFTINEKLPAASENAYPAATTEDVSLTAVPVHSPNPKSLIPKYLPAIGNNITMTISNINVAEIE